jgi:hypothetical protein
MYDEVWEVVAAIWPFAEALLGGGVVLEPSFTAFRLNHEKSQENNKYVGTNFGKSFLIRANLPLIRANPPIIRAKSILIGAKSPLIRVNPPLIRAHPPLIREDPPLIRANPPLIRAPGWSGLPHRDYTYAETADAEGAPRLLSVWIPLNDITLDNGCMYVVPKEFDFNFDRDHVHEHKQVITHGAVKVGPITSQLYYTNYIIVT